MIVLDASVVLELLLRTPAGLEVERRISAPEETLHAPHIIDVEVAHVLRRYALGGHIEEYRAREAVDDLRALDVRRYAHDLLLDRIWALRDNASAHDAAYLALAEGLGAPLLTRDRALAEVPGVQARVQVV